MAYLSTWKSTQPLFDSPAEWVNCSIPGLTKEKVRFIQESENLYSGRKRWLWWHIFILLQRVVLQASLQITLSSVKDVVEKIQIGSLGRTRGKCTKVLFMTFWNLYACWNDYIKEEMVIHKNEVKFFKRPWPNSLFRKSWYSLHRVSFSALLICGLSEL